MDCAGCTDFKATQFIMDCGSENFGSIGELGISSRESMRLIIGWPEGHPLAGRIPSLRTTYIDPLVFKTRSTHHREVPLVYESFSLGDDSEPELPIPYTYERQTRIYLSEPDWFARGAQPAQGCVPKSAWASGESVGCTHFSAVAVQGEAKSDGPGKAETPLDLSGYGPAHYWMPGYVEQLMGLPLVVNVNGNYTIPKTSCTALGSDMTADQGGTLDECVATSNPDSPHTSGVVRVYSRYDDVPSVQILNHTCYG